MARTKTRKAVEQVEEETVCQTIAPQSEPGNIPSEPIIRDGYVQFVGMFTDRAYVKKDAEGGGKLIVSVFDEGGGMAALAMAMTMSNKPLKITIEELKPE